MRIGAAIVCAAVVAAPAAGQQLVEIGRYVLGNHPDGNQQPPLYGFRLDELVDVTSGKDVFTFDFDDVQSAMFLDYDGSTIRISGQAFGGRDVGGSYANDQFLGVYDIDFTYSVGVQFAPGDDDLIVDESGVGQNTGFISGPAGQNIPLVDSAQDGITFRFGDEDNDAGHRGHPGISGWGWVAHSGLPHIPASDWLFTATFLIPTPATGMLGIAGLAFAGQRRR